MRILIYLFFILNFTTSCGQDIDTIVCDISNKNILEHEFVGIGGWKGTNYANFEKLYKSASIEQLLNLMKHDNPVVVCYASWALIEKKYERLPEIFTILIKDDRQVKTQSGCLLGEDSLSNTFYHRYWNLNKKNKTDKTLFELDKIVLNQEKPEWLLLLRSLENRVYTKEYKALIYKLGFEKKYKEAIFYLCKWHRAEYNYELQLFLIEALKKTKFNGRDSYTYYRLMDELIRFNNEDLNDFILDKYRNDPPSAGQIEKFVALLEGNNLF